MTTYATNAELKARLGIFDQADDIQITDALNSASRWIEDTCSQVFYPTTTATTRDFAATDPYILDVTGDTGGIGSTTGLVVTVDPGGDGTFETTLVLNTDFQLLPVNAASASPEAEPWTELRRITGAWPVSYTTWGRVERVRVMARWNWPATPAIIKQVCLELGADQYRYKDAPLGIAGVNDFGPLRVGAQTMDRAYALLGDYRRRHLVR